MRRLFISSEIGKLKSVLLHKPELGLTRLTPSNCNEFLFDDVLFVENAIKEHENFANILKKNDTETLFITNLLSDVIAYNDAKEWLLEEHCSKYILGHILAKQTKEYLSSLDNRKIAQHFIGGLAVNDIDNDSLKNHFTSLVSKEFTESSFILPPLPNHLFSRDSSFWIYNGVVLSPMSKYVRQMETVNLEAIYKFHPMFKSLNFNIWYGGEKINYHSATIEGGDVLVIGKGKLLIGISERTTLQGIENLTIELFKDGQVDEVVMVQIENGRATMHLDTVLSMIDHDKFAYYQNIIHEDTISWSLRISDKEKIDIRRNKNFFKTLARITNNSKVTMIPTGGDIFTSEREQWNDAVNLLALSPGKVICYNKNIHTIENLKKHDIEVLPILGDELCRGRGGTRCMSCPIEREEV